MAKIPLEIDALWFQDPGRDTGPIRALCKLNLGSFAGFGKFGLTSVTPPDPRGAITDVAPSPPGALHDALQQWLLCRAPLHSQTPLKETSVRSPMELVPLDCVYPKSSGVAYLSGKFCRSVANFCLVIHVMLASESTAMVT